MSSRHISTAFTVFLVFILVLVGLSTALGFHGRRLLLFLVIPGIAAALACLGALFYLRRRTPTGGAPRLPELDDLETLVRSANEKLKASHTGTRNIASLPLLYVLGDENSAKTQTVLQAELNPELLAGGVYRDGAVEPTSLANLWYTDAAAIAEAGGKLYRRLELWQKLVQLTQPGKFRAAVRRNDRLPARAAVVCISLEHMLGGTPGTESLRSRAQTLRERLQYLSSAVGVSLPVYVLFTKLDTVPAFPEYAANLTEAESRQSCGALLPRLEGSVGLYSERASAEIGTRFDELCYSLGEFRLELLSRGGAPAELARAYEFPRELRKLREQIIDLLTETGRPNQLGVNPFLRGFFFTGVRAKVVQENQATPGQVRAASLEVDLPGAVFSRSSNTRRVPQWVFLPHLFSEVLLADRSALERSRTSNKVKIWKRSLAGAAASALLVYLIGLTVSWANNVRLTARLTEAAALPIFPIHSENADLVSLHHLDQMRSVFADIATVRDTAPLSYRWGLFQGDQLYAAGCKAYGAQFRTALLAPAQANMVAHFDGLPATPQPSEDYSATYTPLRAYLITTAFPVHSTLEFTPAALEDAWIGKHPVPPETAVMTAAQFRTYAAHLTGADACMATLGGAAQPGPVQRARGYLNQFQGLEQVYLSMKAAADHRFGTIRFNERFPGSARYVVDSFPVEGAFTREGYGFLTNAIAHPESFTSGETWVLGATGGGPIDLGRLQRELPLRYQNDFLNAWRSYLKAAHVVTSGSFPDAREKLHQLDSPSSSLLELFQLLSENTAVENQVIQQAFQAPHVVVPPSRPLPANSGYMQGLQGLEGAINSMLLMPNSKDNPAAVSPVITAASQAESAVESLRSGFSPPDPVGGMDAASERLLMAPIRSAEELARQAPARAAGGGGQALCAALASVLNKFPFNPDGRTDATMAEVAEALQPGKGALAQYAGRLSDTVVLQGNTWVQAPGSMVRVNPAFLHFLNSAQSLGEVLFPATGQPQLIFFLTEEATPNLPAATLTINTVSLNAPGQTRSFSWNFAPASTIRLVGAGNSMTPPSGPWSLLHLTYQLAKHPAPNRLEFVFEVNGHAVTSPSGVPLDYKYDVGGPGAALLNPAYMRGALHCTSKVATQ